MRKTRDRVHAVLESCGPMTLVQLAEELGVSPRTIQSSLSILRADGRVEHSSADGLSNLRVWRASSHPREDDTIPDFKLPEFT